MNIKRLENRSLPRTDIAMLALLAGLMMLSFLAQDPAPVIVTQAETAESASEILPRTEPTPAPEPVQKPVSTLPDFAAIENVRAKKQKFFSYLLPRVRQANDKIRADRKLLLMIRDDLRTGEALVEDDHAFIARIQKKYRVAKRDSLEQTINDLLVRVDVVPESLVLAQAANESGWGTSRFARKANNLFGVWCFTEGCGLTPLSRDEGLTHEVASYDSVQESIEAYMHTINTNPAYTVLRDIRATSRTGEKYIRGIALAEGLTRYSSRGYDYVREIQALIRVNNLHEYTLPLQT